MLSSVTDASVLNSALLLTVADWSVGWVSRVNSGLTVIVTLSVSAISLIAYPVERAVPAVTVDPSGWAYADGITLVFT